MNKGHSRKNQHNNMLVNIARAGKQIASCLLLWEMLPVVLSFIVQYGLILCHFVIVTFQLCSLVVQADTLIMSTSVKTIWHHAALLRCLFSQTFVQRTFAANFELLNVWMTEAVTSDAHVSWRLG